MPDMLTELVVQRMHRLQKLHSQQLLCDLVLRELSDLMSSKTVQHFDLLIYFQTASVHSSSKSAKVRQAQGPTNITYFAFLAQPIYKVLPKPL